MILVLYPTVLLDKLFWSTFQYPLPNLHTRYSLDSRHKRTDFTQVSWRFLIATEPIAQYCEPYCIHIQHDFSSLKFHHRQHMKYVHSGNSTTSKQNIKSRLAVWKGFMLPVLWLTMSRSAYAHSWHINHKRPTTDTHTCMVHVSQVDNHQRCQSKRLWEPFEHRNLFLKAYQRVSAGDHRTSCR